LESAAAAGNLTDLMELQAIAALGIPAAACVNRGRAQSHQVSTERNRLMAWYGGWKPYVSVAQRRAQAVQFAATLAKKRGRALAPVKIDGRKISRSFWGQAWCEHLEGYSDFENRLPRGATYVRNGSVIDLEIESGTVKGIVSGSEIYHVTIRIKTLPRTSWKQIRRDCSASIDSLIDLLQGRLDSGVMQRLTRREGGLFPRPAEIEMDCTCPDWAGMCKHVAAVLYGVGAQLDTQPELLFTLRNVDHKELIRQAAASKNLDRALDTGRDAGLAGADLGELFGIDIETGNGRPKQPNAVGRSLQLAAFQPIPRRGRVCHDASRQSAESEASARLADQGGGKQVRGQVGCPALGKRNTCGSPCSRGGEASPSVRRALRKCRGLRGSARAAIARLANGSSRKRTFFGIPASTSDDA
jgi:uncharacterized Zn finger protein